MQRQHCYPWCGRDLVVHLPCPVGACGERTLLPLQEFNQGVGHVQPHLLLPLLQPLLGSTSPVGTLQPPVCTCMWTKAHSRNAACCLNIANCRPRREGGGIGCRGVHNDVLLGSILIQDDNDAESDRHWCCVESGYRVCALPLYSPVVFVHISGMHADARGAIVTGCRWGWQVNHTCGAPTGGPGGRPHPLDTVLPGPGLRCWVCVKTLEVCDTCWWGLTYIQDIRV